MSDLTDTVREALKQATPGPWEAHDITEIDLDGVFDLAHVVADDPDDPHGDRVAVAASILRADAHLIANAPAWLAALCDRLEVAEEAARAVLALLPGRSEAAAKAEAVRETVARVRQVCAGMPGSPLALRLSQLEADADRIEAQP